MNIRDSRKVEEYQSIFENAAEGIFQSTIDGRYLKVNPAMARIFGYNSPDEMVKSITDISKQIHPEEGTRKKFIEEISTHNQVKGFEARNFRKDQSIIWTRTNARAVRDENGDILYFEGFLTDITAQKEAELALRESEERYRSLVARLPGAVFLDEPDNLEKTIYISQKIKDLLGYSQEEWLSTITWKDCIHPDDRDRVLAENKRIHETGEPFHQEYRLRNKEGDYVWIREELSLVLDANGEPLFWQGFFLNITDQKLAEDVILRSEKQFTKIFRSNPIASTITTFDDGKYIDANQAYYDLSGYQPNELIGRKAVDLGFITEAKRQRFITKLRRKKSIKGAEGHLVTKDGTILNTLEFYEIIRLRDKDHILATFHDITGRVTALRALQESEERYRSLVELSPEAIAVHAEDKLIFVNSAAIKLMGATSANELIGKSVSEILHPDSREFAQKRIQEALKTGETVPLADEKFIKLNGDVIDVEITSQPINYSGKKALQVFVRDISERKQDEETLGHQLEELTILHNVALAASSSNDEDELIQRVTNAIGDTLHSDNCGVELVSKSGNKILPHQSYRRYKQDPERRAMPLDEGICGKVVSTGQSIRLGNVKQESAYIEATSGIQSELCVPIKIQDRVIGVINVESKKTDAYSEADERLLNTVAGTMATAIEQLRLFNTSQRHLQELTILNAVGQASTDATSVDELIEKVTQIIGESTYPDNFGVLLLNKEGTSLIPHPSYRGNSTGKSLKDLSLDQGVSGEVAATGIPIRIANVRTHKKYIEVTSQVRSEVCVPIKHADQILGVINAESVKINAFTEDDEQLLSTIASTLATAMEKLRLLDEEKKRRHDAEALREATAALTTSIELESLYELILDSVSKLIPFDSTSIGIFDQGYVKIVAGRSFNNNKICIDTKYQFDSTRLESPGSLREPIIIQDVRYDDTFKKHEGDEYIRGWMAVPMVVNDQLIGFLYFDSAQSNFYTKEHAALAQTFSHQAAIAIENARLFQEESQRTQIIEAMANITNEFATALEIMPALEKITQRSLELLQASTVAIYMLQDDNETIKVVTALGAYREQLVSHTLQIGTGITGNIIATGKPEIVDDMFNDPRRKKVPGTPEDDAQRDTIMSAPLILRGKTIGAINAWKQRSSGLFNESELNFLVSIANQTSMLIESIRLFQETIRRAEEAHAIAEVGKGISSTLQLDIVLERIAQYAKELLMAETSAVYLSNPEEELLRAIAAIGNDAEEIKNDPLLLGRGILGNIALQKSGEIVNNTLSDDRAVIVRGTDAIPNEHLLGVPVLSKDQLTGLLAVWRTGEDEEFKPFELDFLNSLAQQAAVAIENARLFEAEQKSRKRAETLREVTAALTTSIELETLYEIILDSATKLVPFDSASIEILNDGFLKIVSSRNLKGNKTCVGKQYPFDTTKWGGLEIIREPIIIPNVQEDERFEKLEETDYIRGWMGVPMIIQDRLIGFLNFDSATENFFTSEHTALAQTFGNQVSIAIENARLFEEEQKRRREAETLRQAALAITTSLELESVLETILIVMKQVVPYDSASVLMLEDGKLRLTAARGFSNIEEILNLSFPADDELLQIAQQNREPVILKNAQLDKRFNNWANTDYVRGWMGVPLIIRNEVIGYITFDSRQEDIYDQALASLTQTFAHQAASAVQMARQYETEQRHFQEAETLRQAAEAITSTLDTQQVLSSILDNLNHVIPFDSAAVFLIENENIRLTAAKGMPDNEDSIGKLFPADDVLLQEIAQTRLPLILNDAKNDSRFKKWVTDKAHGWLGVPLIARGVIIGYFTIDSQRVGAYSEHEANLAMTFAHQAAVAIENARLYARGESQIRQLTILRDIDSAISSSFDLRVTLNLLTSYAAKELKADAAAILLFDSDLKSLSLFTNTGFTRNHDYSSSYTRIGEGLAGQVVLNRKLVQIANLDNTTEFAPGDYTNYENFKSYFGVPLIAKGQIKGVLELYTREVSNPDPDWLNFLHTLAGQAAIAIDNVQMFKNLQRSNRELILAYDTTLAGWGRALELRDKETQGHTDRVGEMTIDLARRLGIEGEELTNIMRGTLLHDIGKMGIPDHILHKPGPLTEEEWEIMRQHPQYAYNLIYPIPYLRPALDIPYAHHERWDGSGYPRGLKGEDIPLAARIFAIVDIWDALLNNRVYREAWPEEKVLEYLKNAAGIELDPDIVETFLEMIQEDKYKNRAE